MSFRVVPPLLLLPLVACQAGDSTSSTSHKTEAGATVTEVAGNPTCADLGLDGDVKLEPPLAGESTLSLGSGSITFSIDEAQQYFGWTSTIGIDAIIAKGGPNANVYSYDPEGTWDDGLSAPANASGSPAQLSHISVCFDEDEPPPDPCEGVVCDGATECAEAGVCDPDTGECVYAPIPAGTECSSDDNPCTVDACDGAGGCGHEPGNQGALCRESDGVCGAAEYCDGISAECPADGHADGDTVCREAAGPCDVAEYCTGDSSTCPDDVFAPAGQECTADGHETHTCDPTACTGDGAECPAPDHP
jgi:hypothetical protein